MRRGLSPHGLFALHRERVGAPLASVTLDLDAATIAELEWLTEPVKEAIGRNLDMWSAESRMR